jgi:predicted RecA/RadA family phage recombinase
MKNFVQDGDTIQLTAPVGGVTGGAIFKQGGLVGVVVASAAEGEQFALQLKGVFNGLPKAAEAWTTGDTLYWSTANSNFTKTASGNTLAGFVAADAVSGAATGTVLLNR